MLTASRLTRAVTVDGRVVGPDAGSSDGPRDAVVRLLISSRSPSWPPQRHWAQPRLTRASFRSRSIKYDKDGIDVRLSFRLIQASVYVTILTVAHSQLYWLNSTNHLMGCDDPSTVAEAFQTVTPTGSTPCVFRLPPWFAWRCAHVAISEQNRVPARRDPASVHREGRGRQGHARAGQAAHPARHHRRPGRRQRPGQGLSG